MSAQTFIRYFVGVVLVATLIVALIVGAQRLLDIAILLSFAWNLGWLVRDVRRKRAATL